MPLRCSLRNVLGPILALAFALLGIPRAQSQTFNVPRYWVWDGELPCEVAPDANGFLTRMVYVDAYEWSPPLGTPAGTTPSPERAARLAADYIKSHMAAGWSIDDPSTVCYGVPALAPDLSADTVAITINPLGRDDALTSDPGDPQYVSPLRLFREQDRLFGLNDMDFHFPTPIAWIHTYHHPFLINATAADAPMKVWMDGFVNELWAIGNDPNHDPYYAGLLPPTRWIFDCEAQITWQGSMDEIFDPTNSSSENYVEILYRIAESNGNTVEKDYWNTLLPGDPDGFTLAQRYAHDAALFGWPSDILDATAGLRRGRQGSEARNRPYMVWWSGLCFQARAAVFAHSVYGPIAAKFPTAKVANYNDARLDGKTGKTGWFYDCPTMGDTCPQDIVDNGLSDRVWSNMFPRVFFDQDGAYMWHIGQTTGSDPTELRWGTATTTTTGSLASPVLYPMPDEYNWHKHRQPNLYLPHSPIFGGADSVPIAETRVQTSLRLCRAAVEAVLDSKPTFDPNDLIPWVYEVGTANPDGSLFTKQELTRFCAMLRAKNLREAIFFTGPAFGANGAEHDSWIKSSDTLRNVYMARVAVFTLNTGTTAVGQTNDQDTSRLEFTLNNAAGAPRTVNLASATMVDGTQGTELVVKFSGLTGVGTPDALINVECAATSLGVKGVVYMYKFQGEDAGWKLVRTEDFPPGGNVGYADYGFYTPDITSRRTHRLSGFTAYVNSEGYSLVKLVHAASVAFVSKYDLVQLIPMWAEGDPSGGYAAVAVPQSDSTYDQVAESVDLLQFLSNWSSASPAADVNLDETVDVLDMARFLDQYAEEH